jgi:glycosyltransferase involved in cell wall biosynthesis
MPAQREPRVSVVVPTHNRAQRLRKLLQSLREQSVTPDAFEVIVVDDASADETRSVLDDEAAAGGLDLRVIRRDRSGGPAAARNQGWRAALAPLIAFTDDDCVAQPGWLEAGIAAGAANPGAIVQGRTDPDPGELESYGPFSHTLRIPEPTPWFETCNAFYPRALLERLDGFDERTFSGPSGEDADLAWRAIESGADHVFSDDARVFHAVLDVGPIGRIRQATLRSDAVAAMARHPELRRRHVWRRVFWDQHHELFIRALAALVLRRRLGPLAIYRAAPYVEFLTRRRTGPLLAPYLIAHDLVEVAAVVRGAVRARTFMV